MAKKAQAGGNIEERIVSVDEGNPYVKILVYGRSGSGKTRFASSAPNVLIIDINERGVRSVRNSGAKVLYVSQWEDVGNAYWYLKRGQHEFESVALDTLTQMQSLCMRFVLGEAEARDPTREPSMPDRRAWGKVAELMKPQLLAFRNLPMHVIYTAQERKEEDEDSGERLITADLSPGSRGTALGSVEVIGRMFRREVKLKGQKKAVWQDRMLVGPHEEYDTKDRTNALGHIMRQPTVPKIIEAANSGRE